MLYIILIHISRFMFILLMDLLLAILDLFQPMEMMLDKKQIQAIFLFEFKMGHKAAKTTCNINTFGPGTVNDLQCNGGSRSR